jgi:hypothetical protein
LKYTNGIWDQLKERKFEPDLIFIDGRFRVATFLMSLINAPGAKIIFDDYMDRPEYQIVETILPLSYSVGRLGIFEIPKIITQIMRSQCDFMLEKYIFRPQ